MNLKPIAVCCAALLLASGSARANGDPDAAAIRGVFATYAAHPDFDGTWLPKMKPYLSPPTYALLAGYFASKRQPGCFIDEDPFSHSQMNQLGSAPIRLAPDGKVLADSAYLVTAPTFGKGTHPAKSLVLVSARHLVDDVAAVGQDGAPQFDDTIVTSLKRFRADPACHWK